MENRTTTIYDDAGRNIVMINPLDHHSTMLYDAANQLTALIDQRAKRQTSTYDALGQNLSRHYPDCFHVTFAFEGVGR